MQRLFRRPIGWLSRPFRSARPAVQIPVRMERTGMRQLKVINNDRPVPIPVYAMAARLPEPKTVERRFRRQKRAAGIS